MNTKDLDKTVVVAFGELVSKASRSKLLGKIAFQPDGRHEKTISDWFASFLSKQISDDARVLREESERYAEGNAYRHDIVVKLDSRVVAVVEIKTPFTDPPGIRGKTRKPEHLPKDMRALKAALNGGAYATYELITPIGCYPVDSDGNMVVLHNAISKNAEALKKHYGIQWPTRRDYETNPEHGKPEVDRAMKELAGELSLVARRIKGWQKIVLPQPKPNIRAFIDCALYKVQLK